MPELDPPDIRAERASAEASALSAHTDLVFARSAADAPEVGTRIGRFVLKAQLGRGAMGTVWKAVDPHSGEHVALKVAATGDQDRAGTIANEARLLPRARHPNVVAVVDSGSDVQWTWLALALVEGETLAAVALRATAMENGRGNGPDARTIVGWFRDLARALATLHEAKLLHRDIKPANIVFDRKRRPVLIDFGLAIEIERGDVEAYLAGTLPYMSPEQTQAGYSALNERSDVYGLAITFHEVLTGARFAIGRTAGEVLQRVAFAPVPMPSAVAKHVPASLDPIFRRALAKHPRDRYASAEQLADDLDAWLNDRPLRWARQGSRQRAVRLVRRHPVTSVLVLLASVGIPVALALRAFDRASAQHDVIARIRADLDGEDYGAAADAAVGWLERRGDDSHVAALHGLAIRELASLAKVRLVESTIFTMASAGGRAPPREIAAWATRHLAWHAQDDLVFVVAFSATCAGDLDEAEQVLTGHAESARRPALLNEVAALIALQRRDADTYRERAAILIDERHADDSSLCLRTYRLLREAEVARRDHKFEVLVRDGALMRAAVAIDNLLVRNQDHELARSMRATYRLMQGDPTGAFEDLAKLDPGPDAFDRAAVLYLRAIAEIERSQPGPESWPAAWDRAFAHIGQAVQQDVRWGADFAAWKLTQGPHRIERAQRLVDQPWISRVDLDRRGWKGLLLAVDDLESEERRAEIVDLLHAVAALCVAPNDPGEREDYELLGAFLLWSLVHQSPARLDGPIADAHEQARLTEAMAVLSERRRTGVATWDDEVAGTLAAARHAAITHDAALAKTVADELDRLAAAERVAALTDSILHDPKRKEEDRPRHVAVLQALALRCRQAAERLRVIGDPWR